MTDHLRRFLFAFSVFIVALAMFALVRSHQAGYGLLDLLKGKGPGEQFTAAQGPKLSESDVAGLTRLDEEYAKLCAAVLPSVVSVNTKSLVQRQRMFRYGFFDLPRMTVEEQAGLGSGAVISKEGHVITNYHVIAGATELKVVMNDGKEYTAHVIDGSKVRDIALIKIDSDRKDFPPLSFADSDKVRVGEIVFAVGNPFGLSGTVTQGIISASNRTLSDGSANDYLQTDTVINPGNSGGPLVNVRGEIVGVNVAIFRGDQNYQAWQGVGLAVPGNEAKRVIDSVLALRAGKRDVPISKGFVGLMLDQRSLFLNLPTGKSLHALLVRDVYEGSPAAKAGLQPGDVLLELNGAEVTTAEEVLENISKMKPGAKFTLGIYRNGQIGELTGVVSSTPTA
jgi:S1-C subfamily serine protease